MGQCGQDGSEVFRCCFEALAAESLNTTQFVIIDNEFPPVPKNLSVRDRYMPPSLIPQYTGA
jgi:hypothetical protein